MIVAPQPEAVDAGARVLADGGNVVDAAVAAALVQGVVDPLMCGIGGFGIMQIATPDGRRVVVDGLGQSPSGATDTMWEAGLLGPTTDGFGYRVEGFVNETGAQSVMVPGTVKTLMTVHRRYGSWPWADLFDEAIRSARTGWLVRPHVHTVFLQNEAKYGRMDFGDKLATTEDGRRIYLRDGELPRVGDTIVNPELADTLELLASAGGAALYEGELANVVADSVLADGGILTATDLSRYEVRRTEPMTAGYRGLTLSVPPPPAGGPQLLQTLGILERFDLGDLEHNSPGHIQLLAEAMKRALRDKEDLWARAEAGDGDYAALIAPEALDAAAADVRAGVRVDVDAPRYESRHTTHLNVMDAHGFAVSFSHTLGNPSGYIPRGTGFVLNGGMSTFDPRPGSANSIAPGRRRNSTMCPAFVLADDEPAMAVGAPGASWIVPAVAQVVSDVFDFGMTAQEAVMAPRIAATSNAIDISNRIPRRVESELGESGYEVRRSALSYAFAGVHAITRFEGVLAGGADPQRDGYAAAVP